MAGDEIPFDQRDGYIWIDGKIVEWKDAKVHVLSHGMHYGSGVFEGERMRFNEVEEINKKLSDLNQEQQKILSNSV